MSPICSRVRRYTLTANGTGNRSDAHARSLLSSGRCQGCKSRDIDKPHCHQPFRSVFSVQYRWALIARVSDGLLHPHVDVAFLYSLYFDVQSSD